MLSAVKDRRAALDPPDFDVVAAVPEFALLRAAVAAQDWNAVVRFFGGLPDSAAHDAATRLAADVADSKDFFGTVAAQRPDST
jgi:hypothetical protein